MKDKWDNLSIEEENPAIGDKIWRNIQRKVSLKRYIWTGSAFAATLVAASLAIVVALHRNPEPEFAPTSVQMVQFYAQSSQKLVLPDGSTVYLDAGSEISYPGNMENSRIVDLRGNAVFDVMKKANQQHFIVNVESSFIEVKGTSFAVSTEKGKEVSVILYSGAVDFVSTSNGQSVSLKPFNKLSYDIQDQSFKVNPSFGGVAWNNGAFVIKDANLQDIAAFIEWRYGVKIDLASSIGRSHKLNGVIGYDETCEAVIEKFCFMLDLKSGQTGGKYCIYSE